MSRNFARLILVRHGEVESNRKMHYLGLRDDELNDRGRQQAVALARELAQIRCDRVLTSPLRRAEETARLIAERQRLTAETEQRLCELDFGEWEGRSRAEVMERSPEDRLAVERWEADPTRSIPGGGSLAELQSGVIELADELADGGNPATFVLVSHMGPIKALLCAALGLPLTSAARVFLDPATISVIDWGDRRVVRLVNSHSHLGFANARWIGAV